MQHGHVLKNLYINFLTPKAGEGGSVGEIFATMWLHS